MSLDSVTSKFADVDRAGTLQRVLDHVAVDLAEDELRRWRASEWYTGGEPPNWDRRYPLEVRREALRRVKVVWPEK